ncbi:MAG TPA: hypothetical protein VEK55_17430 [Xanthobacteraceae bacterium]|nr:hypothetical protein [Xanthobacteraceae bacterium]
MAIRALTAAISSIVFASLLLAAVRIHDNIGQQMGSKLQLLEYNPSWYLQATAALKSRSIPSWQRNCSANASDTRSILAPPAKTQSRSLPPSVDISKNFRNIDLIINLM